MSKVWFFDGFWHKLTHKLGSFFQFLIYWEFYSYATISKVISSSFFFSVTTLRVLSGNSVLFCSSACFFKAAGSKHTSSSSDYAAWRPIINLFFPLDSSYNNSFNRMLYYILFEMCFLNQSSYMHLPWLFVCIFGQFSIITILAFDHMLHNGWKSLKMSHLNFFNFGIFH